MQEANMSRLDLGNGEGEKSTKGAPLLLTMGQGPRTSIGDKKDIALDRNSIIYKILKTMHNYTTDENVDRLSIENILIAGGMAHLGELSNLIE